MIDINTEVYGRPFSLKVGNGTFAYPSDGGTGKSYVADILKDLELKNVLVVKYDGDTERVRFDIERAIKGSYDLVYLDRSDMFIDEELFEKFVNIGKNATVIFDVKKRYDYMKDDLRTISIYYGKKGVKVF